MPRYHPYICERCSHAVRRSLSHSVHFFPRCSITFHSIARGGHFHSFLCLTYCAYCAIRSHKNQTSPLPSSSKSPARLQRYFTRYFHVDKSSTVNFISLRNSRRNGQLKFVEPRSSLHYNFRNQLESFINCGVTVYTSSISAQLISRDRIERTNVQSFSRPRI